MESSKREFFVDESPTIEFTILAPMAAIFLTRNSWKLNFRGCKDRDGFSRRNRPRDRRNEEIRPIVDDEVTMTGWRGGYS